MPEQEPSIRFVSTTTCDGLTNTGALYEPAGSQTGTAIILIHGQEQNFYQPLMLALAEAFARAGYPTVSGNNRGHDLAIYARHQSGTLLTGSAWEKLDQSNNDIRAWIDFLAARGARRIILAGHDRGAWKVIHYQAENHDERVAAILALSGILEYKSITFRARHAILAQEWTMFGHGEDFMPQAAHDHKISAMTYLDLFNHYASDNDSEITQIDVPLLSLYGEAEPVSDEDIEREAAFAARSPQVNLFRVPGACHDYCGQEQMAAEIVLRWLAEVLPL